MVVFAALVVGTAVGVLEFPLETTKRLIINVGPNLIPAQSHRSDTHVIAIEPMVGCRIRPAPQLSIVHAAVAANDTLMFMNFYHANGESSSLSQPNVAAFWNTGRNSRGPHVVPVLSMRTILSSVSPAQELWYLKTDMQGFDFQGVVAGGRDLLKAHYILTEVWWGQVHSYGQGEIQNDFCANFFPYMTALGFEVIRGEDGYKDPDHLHDAGAGQIVSGMTHAQIAQLCQTQRGLAWQKGSNEGDVFWRRVGTTLEEPVWREGKENP